MKDQKNKKTKEEQTPIIDGDTRPDKNIEPDPAIRPIAKKPEKKITPERGADINDLEDFKDAK